jgi:hypothetical protein
MHFIVALRAAVTRAAPQVGEWDAAGARYTVNDERAFLRLLAVTKTNTLRRQLTRYGFARWECFELSFAHPLFLRDLPDLQQRIRGRAKKVDRAYYEILQLAREIPLDEEELSAI